MSGVMNYFAARSLREPIGDREAPAKATLRPRLPSLYETRPESPELAAALLKAETFANDEQAAADPAVVRSFTSPRERRIEASSSPTLAAPISSPVGPATAREPSSPHEAGAAPRSPKEQPPRHGEMRPPAPRAEDDAPPMREAESAPPPAPSPERRRAENPPPAPRDADARLAASTEPPRPDVSATPPPRTAETFRPTLERARAPSEPSVPRRGGVEPRPAAPAPRGESPRFGAPPLSLRTQAASAPAVPRVQVTIGRIEIRAAQAQAPARTPPPRPAPAMSLDDYLAKREKG
jgi:hypothetical protein